MRIGLLGGSFNPAHAGHLAMSLYALKRMKLDQLCCLTHQPAFAVRKHMLQVMFFDISRLPFFITDLYFPSKHMNLQFPFM